MTYEQGDLLQLATSDRCEHCDRKLRTQRSRDRGQGPKCYAKTHTEPSRTTRGGAWWLPQTGPNLIDEKGRAVAIRTEISQYTISAAPPHRDRHFAITVDRRLPGDGSPYWVVMHLGYYLGTDGTWSPGPKSDADADAWWDAVHHDLETALRLAEVAAPDVEVNGKKARDL